MSRDYADPRMQRGGYYGPPAYEYGNYYQPQYDDYYYQNEDVYYEEQYPRYETDRRGGPNNGGRRRRTDRGGGGGGGGGRDRNQGRDRNRRGRQQQGGGYRRNDRDQYYNDYVDDGQDDGRRERRRGGRRGGQQRRDDGRRRNNRNWQGQGQGRRRGGWQERDDNQGDFEQDQGRQAQGQADDGNEDRNAEWREKRGDEETFNYEAEDWKDHIPTPQEDTRIQTEDVTATKGAKFEDYNLSRPLLRGLYESGFLAPSPVQEESIPLIFMGKNVMCRAKNGTGKTGAYAIPCLERVEPTHRFTQVLVLVPTRELALQTSKVIRDLGKYLNIYTVVTTGGTSLKDDIIRLKKTVHILVGTPGRVLDLLQNQHANVSDCRLIVMDEADKLLSPDFVPLIENILQFSPEDRQLMLYSATFPSAVKEFQQNWMLECEHVNLMHDLTLRGVTQYYAFMAESDKVHCLFTLFKMLKINQSIIFCNSINRVELLARKIHKLGFSSFYIHARMRQSDRNRVFHQFRLGKCRTLVCTDLITRGIDIQSVNVVINFDFPKASETYLHRIGRSGRFGHLGLAINFITDKDRLAFYTIERELQTQIDPIPSEVDEKLYCA